MLEKAISPITLGLTYERISGRRKPLVRVGESTQIYNRIVRITMWQLSTSSAWRQNNPIVPVYELLGLRDLPFPSDGFVDPYSSDPRTNGSIYAVSTAQSAISKFESLLIRPDDFPNRVRLAYLWAKGDSQSGRGVGKTALLRYFRQRINCDWGQTEFNGLFSAVVVYVGFRSQIDRRHIEQMALSALVDVCKNGVLDASRAALRLNAIPEGKVEAILADETEGTSGADNLLND